MIDHLLPNKRYADCAVGREQAAEGNGRLTGIKSGIDLTTDQPGRGGGGVNKNWNAQTGVACREDTGRDVRSFLTEVRSEQSSHQGVRPENTADTHGISQQRAGRQWSRYVVFVCDSPDCCSPLCPAGGALPCRVQSACTGRHPTLLLAGGVETPGETVVALQA